MSKRAKLFLKVAVLAAMAAGMAPAALAAQASPAMAAQARAPMPTPPVTCHYWEHRRYCSQPGVVVSPEGPGPSGPPPPPPPPPPMPGPSPYCPGCNGGRSAAGPPAGL